jgi:hypothetical protein
VAGVAVAHRCAPGWRMESPLTGRSGRKRTGIFGGGGGGRVPLWREAMARQGTTINNDLAHRFRSRLISITFPTETRPISSGADSNANFCTSIQSR